MINVKSKEKQLYFKSPTAGDFSPQTSAGASPPLPRAGASTLLGSFSPCTFGSFCDPLGTCSFRDPVAGHFTPAFPDRPFQSGASGR